MSDTLSYSLKHDDEWLRNQVQPLNFVSRRPLRPKNQQLFYDITPHTSIRRPIVPTQLERPSLSQEYGEHHINQNVSLNQNANSPLSANSEYIAPRATPTRGLNRLSRSYVLRRDPLVNSQVKPQPKRGIFRLSSSRLIPNMLVFLGIVVFSVGMYAGIAGLKATHDAQLQALALTKVANAEAKNDVNPTTNASPSSTSSNSTAPVLSTVKPATNTISSYTVAPDLPRYLIIPKLSVDARVLQVGTTSSGALGTPDNVFDTAWYNKSSKPGQPGAMLIDGHISSWTSKGVFYGLDTLVAGDVIQVERGDGTMFTYQVVKVAIYNASEVNMQAAMTPVNSSVPGLNLISCTGDVIPGTSTFNERIIVFAEQTS